MGERFKNWGLVLLSCLVMSFIITMAYLQIKPLWSKANTEIQQRDLLQEQVEYDRRQTEALEMISAQIGKIALELEEANKR